MAMWQRYRWDTGRRFFNLSECHMWSWKSIHIPAQWTIPSGPPVKDIHTVQHTHIRTHKQTSIATAGKAHSQDNKNSAITTCANETKTNTGQKVLIRAIGQEFFRVVIYRNLCSVDCEEVAQD